MSRKARGARSSGDPRIQKFLDAASRRIRDRKARDAARAELDEHLRCVIDELIRDGLAPEAAVGSALERMGSGEVLGRELGRVHRPIYLQWTFLMPVVICTAIIVAGATIEVWNRSYLRGIAEFEAWLHQIQASFLEDQRILKASGIFESPPVAALRPERDAGRVLNDRLGWVGKVEEMQEVRAYSRNLGFGVPESAEKKLDVAPDWTQLTDIPEVRDADLMWMKALAKYDHWDLHATGPLQRYIQANRGHLHYFQMPSPDFSLLRTAVKLRILRGIAQRDVLPALREVRKLVRLLYSTEEFVAAIVAVSYLSSVERRGAEAAIHAGLLVPGQWDIPSKDLTERARRAVYGMPSIISTFPQSEAMKEIEAGEVTVGLCSAISERIAGEYMYPDLFSAKYPFERDLSAYSSRFMQLLASPIVRSRCRVPLAKLLANDLGWPERALANIGWNAWSDFKYRWGIWIPWVRQSIGIGDLYSAPNYLSRYKVELPKE